jgi:hypothetical protein
MSRGSRPDQGCILADALDGSAGVAPMTGGHVLRRDSVLVVAAHALMRGEPLALVENLDGADGPRPQRREHAANPQTRPQGLSPWRCGHAAALGQREKALPACPQQKQQQTTKTSSRDSRLTPRLRRCQKPTSQNASRPGRHQIGMLGEIISESWVRSSESAIHGPPPAVIPAPAKIR